MPLSEPGERGLWRSGLPGAMIGLRSLPWQSICLCQHEWGNPPSSASRHDLETALEHHLPCLVEVIPVLTVHAAAVRCHERLTQRDGDKSLEQPGHVEQETVHGHAAEFMEDETDEV